MTDHSGTLDNRSFYEGIATQYDEMTDFKQRFQNARAFVDTLNRTYRLNTAIDAACGSGVYALALAEKDIATYGLDVSPGMIMQARQHGEQVGVGERVTWLSSPMERLRSVVTAQDFDAVLCMGNSLPHLTGKKQFEQVMQGFYSVLRPGGILISQLLNYTKVLNECERIVSIDRKNQQEFVRFYDFLGGHKLRFNILNVQWKNGKAVNHSLSSTSLYAYTEDILSTKLAEQGFQQEGSYEDLRFSPFCPETSDVFLTVWRKPENAVNT